MTEYWDLLDENREPLGMLHRRGDALPAGARHLCVEIITVWEGKMLTTRRHPQKHNGGYWEVTTRQRPGRRGQPRRCPTGAV